MKEQKPMCPIEATLAMISGKWKILIIKALSQGPVRYGDLAREIPQVSAKVLTEQLREMEQDGLVSRTVFPEVPPRVEYSLSKMGAALAAVLEALRNFGLTQDQVHDVECSFCLKCRDITQQGQA